MERLNFWREMYKSAAPDERPLVATLGRLIANKGVAPADLAALEEFTAVNCSVVTPKVIDVMARRFIQKICPPNCYNSDGIIQTPTGKHSYINLRCKTSLPVEISTAPIGDCSKCTYRKARGTKYDSCAKCPELKTYFEWTHSNVYTTPAQMIIFKCGLSPYEEILKIGYDPTTLEIILPLTRRQYVTLELANRAASSVEDFKDRENARRVLSHYNLLPRTNGEIYSDGRCNSDSPYLDNRFIGLNGEIVFATCIGQVYRKINLPFSPTEEIKFLQPYKI